MLLEDSITSYTVYSDSQFCISVSLCNGYSSLIPLLSRDINDSLPSAIIVSATLEK